jgi:hypothetical protein
MAIPYNDIKKANLVREIKIWIKRYF